MQSIGTSFRCAVRGSRHTLPIHQTAPTRVLWVSQRNASFLSPLSWIQEKLAPRPREKPTEKEGLAASEKPGLFDAATTAEPDKVKARKSRMDVSVRKQRHTEHKYSTPNFKISHRKLNMLGRQIAGKPIDHAIMQMHFSEKRASKRIETMLSTAKSHAVNLKHLPGPKLVVAEAWVTKGPKQLKRFEPKGRGKFGIRVHPDSRMHVVLKPGKTHKQKVKEERERKLKRIVSAGLVREDIPLRNPSPMWSW